MSSDISVWRFVCVMLLYFSLRCLQRHRLHLFLSSYYSDLIRDWDTCISLLGKTNTHNFRVYVRWGYWIVFVLNFYFLYVVLQNCLFKLPHVYMKLIEKQRRSGWRFNDVTLKQQFTQRKKSQFCLLFILYKQTCWSFFLIQLMIFWRMLESFSL